MFVYDHINSMLANYSDLHIIKSLSIHDFLELP